MTSGGDFVDVHLLGFPVELFVRSRQHHDELLREFALIAMGDHAGVPAQLLALTDDLLDKFGRESSELRDQVEEGVRRGDQAIDVVAPMPRAAAAAVLALDAMLDKADAFCREGESLLTLATPPDLLAFRRWYLGQIVEQVSGRDPTPWAASPGAVEPVALRAEIELDAEPASAGAARRFVRTTLEAWGLEALEEAAILLTSELITNALLHAKTPMQLRLRRVNGLLRVEVSDDNARAPVRRHYDADASTGRGLALVEALAHEWGVDADDAEGGKSVWFTLSLENAS